MQPYEVLVYEALLKFFLCLTRIFLIHVMYKKIMRLEPHSFLLLETSFKEFASTALEKEYTELMDCS